MKQVFLSVVIPMYNKQPYIAQTLDCVLSQSYDAFEVIVVDDGSTDGSASVVESYLQKDSRVHLIRQENSGVSVARNRGMDVAKGDYYVLLDADDRWEVNHLSEIATLASEFPTAGMLGTAYVHSFPVGPDVAIIVANLEGQRGLLDEYFKYASAGQPICASSVAIASWAVHDVGGFEPGARFGEDLDLWARVALKYPVAYSGEVTSQYIHGVSGQATSSIPVYYSNCHCRTLEMALVDECQSPERKKFIRKVGNRSALTVSSQFFSNKSFNRKEWDRYLFESRIGNITNSLVFRMMRLFPFQIIWKTYFTVSRVFSSRKFLALLGGARVKSGLKLKLR